MIVRPGASTMAAPDLLDQARRQMQAGQLADADWSLRQQLSTAPNDVGALAMLADLALRQGRRDEAMLMLSRAVAAAPDRHDLRGLLIDQRAQSGDLEGALAEARRMPDAVRRQPGPAKLEANLLGHLGRSDEELATYRALLEQHPDDAEAWLRFGHALKTAGDLDAAVDALRRAIALRPSMGEAWWGLANFKAVRFDDADLSAMRKALRGRIADDDALHFHFALGKAYEDRDAYPQSFKHYDEGNRIRSRRFTAQETTITPRVDAAIATFTPDLFEARVAAGDPSDAPIFVVGLQRSGSTLVEQILASHPLIEGTSELPAMDQLWQRIGGMGGRSGNPFLEISKLDDAALTRLGADYLDAARPFRKTDRPHFVDKLPANWLNVGLIRLILPNARIVDARRFPLACGFSNFKQHYAAGVTFAYSQDSIGRFYADYLRLMRHFDGVLPGFVHHLLNERLIDDPEGETRRLLDFVGVPFDVACLTPHANKRAVHTPSAEQVRRPINRDGVDYWRHYERWLGPM
ncbi:MAG TPA: sulfotransferase, partial [Sphingomicrobium sp.]|nr:sulfotransferase [Sphingomicrobium sp.]